MFILPPPPPPEHTQVGNITADAFQGVGHLEVLSLRANILTSIKAEMFLQLRHLTDLDLSMNRISDLPEDVFSSLDELKHLNLEGNRLTALPDNIFDGNLKLARLSLSGNNFKSIPAQVTAVKTLSDLSLHQNTIGPLGENAFKVGDRGGILKGVCAPSPISACSSNASAIIHPVY